MNRSRVLSWRLGRLLSCAIALSLMISGSAFAQLQTGNVFGTVVDNQGAAIPGVTVTLTGPGAPGVFVTDLAGKFRFLSLSPGRYSVRAELSGFGNVVRNNLDVNVGRNSEVTLTLAPALEQTITVTAETPLLDVRKTGTGTTVTKVELDQIPTARDPWVILQTSPGVQVDRMNIGGNESGQQSIFVGKGASFSNNTFNVDGVNITDMAATGSTPTYYDFDSFEEMQITTGGSDPRIQTPGVQLNMVTKRGTNEIRGSSRYFVTDNEWQKDATVPDEAKSYLGRANEIDHVDDYGLEVGLPIWRDRLWIWGAYSKQQVDLLAAVGVAPGATAAFDKTTLENWNGKLNAQIMSNNSAVGLYTFGDKIKLGRNVGPSRPPGTGWNQSGPTALYKIEDTHIFSPNFYLTGLYSVVEGGFALTPQNGRNVDAYLDQGVWGGSFVHYETTRPQESYRADASTFFDTGSLNHELKFGFGYRDTPTESLSAWPGSGNWGYFGDGFALAVMTRQGVANYGTTYTDLYVGDTMLLGNLTLQVGLRYDLQEGSNSPSSTVANTVIPDILPSVAFSGDAQALEWTSISPRIGATYSLGTTRRTLLRGSYNRYVGQLSAGPFYDVSPIAAYQALYYYWDDANGDKNVQRGELDFDTGGLPWYNIDPENPSSNVPLGRFDYDMKPPKTDEFVIGLEQELLPEFTVGLNYTHRVFSDFLWRQYEKGRGTNNFYSTADYELATTTARPDGLIKGTLPDGTPYSVPLYRLKAGTPAPFNFVTTNRPDYEQNYDGIELVATKRLSNRWMLRGNFTWMDWTQDVGPDAIVDPSPLFSLGGGTCTTCDGATVSESSGAGSGAKGFVFINSSWSYNVTALYQFPWQISFGANVNGREGYPLPFYGNVNPSDGSGTKNLLLTEDTDTFRNDDVFNLDLRLAKEIRFSGVGLTLSVDLFNATDERTILQRTPQILSRDALFSQRNRVFETQSPQIFKIGARITF